MVNVLNTSLSHVTCTRFSSMPILSLSWLAPFIIRKLMVVASDDCPCSTNNIFSSFNPFSKILLNKMGNCCYVCRYLKNGNFISLVMRIWFYFIENFNRRKVWQFHTIQCARINAETGNVKGQTDTLSHQNFKYDTYDFQKFERKKFSIFW